MESNIYYKELEKQNILFRKYIEKISIDECREAYEYLYNRARFMRDLNSIAIKEGLLELEEWSEKPLKIIKRSPYIKFFLSLIVDGTDPEIIEDIAWSLYFTRDYDTLERIAFIITLKGVLLIQSGCNPRIMIDYMKTLLPAGVYKGIKQDDDWINLSSYVRDIIKEEQDNVIHKQYDKKSCYTEANPKYIFNIIMRYLLSRIDDRSVQFILQSITDDVLEIAMLGLDGDCRKRILINSSREKAYKIANFLSSENFEKYVKFIPISILKIIERYFVYINSDDTIKYSKADKEFNTSIALLITVKEDNLDNALENLYRQYKEKFDDCDPLLEKAEISFPSDFNLERKETMIPIEKIEDSREKFYRENDNFITTMTYEMYIKTTVIEYIFEIIDDISIQRILRDMDGIWIANVLLCLSKNCRNRLFDNMSKRQCELIIGTMDVALEVYNRNISSLDERFKGVKNITINKDISNILDDTISLMQKLETSAEIILNTWVISDFYHDILKEGKNNNEAYEKFITKHNELPLLKDDYTQYICKENEDE